jgi:putative oxidoreductase
MKKFITLSFVPSSTDCGLLLLRLWYGISIFALHGRDKFANFGQTVGMFQGMGIPWVFAASAVIAESVCAVCLVIGLGTRWAASFLAVTMIVAFTTVHHAHLKGANNGELAFLYLGAFAALILAGAGRWSLDAVIRNK